MNGCVEAENVDSDLAEWASAGDIEREIHGAAKLQDE
jgi:hypothetical protein